MFPSRSAIILWFVIACAGIVTPTRADWTDDFEPSPGSQQTWQQTALHDGEATDRHSLYPDGAWATLPYYDGTLGSGDEGLIVFAFNGNVDTIVSYVDEAFQDGTVEALVAQSVSENGVPASADVGVFARGNPASVGGYALTLLFHEPQNGGGDVRLSRYDQGQENVLGIATVAGFSRQEDYFLQLDFRGSMLTGKVFAEPGDVIPLAELNANDGSYASGVSGVIVDRGRGTFAAGLYDDVTATAAASQQLPGDFDGDGRVGGGDFLLWQRETNDPGLSIVEWQTNFGAAAFTMRRMSSVPEPTAAVPLAALLLSGVRRQRHCFIAAFTND